MSLEVIEMIIGIVSQHPAIWLSKLLLSIVIGDLSVHNYLYIFIFVETDLISCIL